MRLPIAFAALAALSLPASAQMIVMSPQQVGEIWCIASLGNDMAPAEALLTPALEKIIADANAKNDAIAKKAPGDIPPLGDGIPWRSAPDYADGCKVGAVTATAKAATVEIKYTFKGTPTADYADTLQLEPVVTETGSDPFWRIGNVKYTDKTLLTDELVAAFDGY